MAGAETLGERLSRAMKEKGLKNPSVASVAGVHVTTVSRWRSNVQVPSESQLQVLAGLLEVSPKWLRYGRLEAEDLRGDVRMPGVHETWPGAYRLAADAETEASWLPLDLYVLREEALLGLIKRGARRTEVEMSRHMMSATAVRFAFEQVHGRTPSDAEFRESFEALIKPLLDMAGVNVHEVRASLDHVVEGEFRPVEDDLAPSSQFAQPLEATSATQKKRKRGRGA